MQALSRGSDDDCGFSCYCSCPDQVPDVNLPQVRTCLTVCVGVCRKRASRRVRLTRRVKRMLRSTLRHFFIPYACKRTFLTRVCRIGKVALAMVTILFLVLGSPDDADAASRKGYDTHLV